MVTTTILVCRGPENESVEKIHNFSETVFRVLQESEGVVKNDLIELAVETEINRRFSFSTFRSFLCIIGHFRSFSGIFDWQSILSIICDRQRISP